MGASFGQQNNQNEWELKKKQCEQEMKKLHRALGIKDIKAHFDSSTKVFLFVMETYLKFSCKERIPAMATNDVKLYLM